MKEFKLLSLLQFSVWLGIAMTGFSLGLWVYQKNGSQVEYSLISFFTIVPSLILSPFAGFLTDKIGPKKVLIWANTLGLLPVVLLGILFGYGKLTVQHIYFLEGLSSSFMAFGLAAYSVCITHMVETKDIVKANGLFQLGQNGPAFMAPLLSGLVLSFFGLETVMVLCLFFILLNLLVFLFKKNIFGVIETHQHLSMKNLKQELTFGFNYILKNKFLRNLALFNSGIHFFLGIVCVLAPPLLLEITNPKIMGICLFMSSTGLIIGGLMVPSRQPIDEAAIKKMFSFSLLIGIAIIFAAIKSSLMFFTVGAFFIFFFLAQFDGGMYSLWQVAVPKNHQGRVFAARRILTLLPTPFAYILGGQLSEKFFIPIMKNPANEFFLFVGRHLGTGNNRGLTLFFLLIGLLLILYSLLFAKNKNFFELTLIPNIPSQQD